MEGVAEWQVNAVIVFLLTRKFSQRRVSGPMVVAMHLFHGAALRVFFRLLLLGFVGTTILSSMVLGFALVYSAVTLPGVSSSALRDFG